MRLWTVIAVAALGGCESGGPESAIRELTAAAETAVERRDAAFFGAVVAPGYRDRAGNDRDRLLDSIEGYLNANPGTRIITEIDELVPQGGDAARLVMTVGFAASEGQAVLGIGIVTYRMTVDFVKDGERWRAIYASWERAAGER